MTTRIQVLRYTGELGPSPDDPVRRERKSTVVYEGKAKIQTYEAYESLPESAGAVLTSVRLRVDVPVGAFTAEPGDEVHVLKSSSDTDLVGLIIRINTVSPYKTHATAYRLQGELVTHG